jgi:hypothetical protein
MIIVVLAAKISGVLDKAPGTVPKSAVQPPIHPAARWNEKPAWGWK